MIVQPRAEADIRRHVRSISENVSDDHAIAWAKRMRAAVASLARMPERCGFANEAAVLGLPLRHLLVGDQPHVYRVLFVIRGHHVIVVRVRHGAQAPLQRADITFPRGDRP
jgi:plasmid stabilization system protein ParE